MAKSFEELMSGVWKLLPLEKPERAIAGEPVFINDVMFTLIHDKDIDPERIFLFASFGDMPRDRTVEVLAALLKENHVGMMGDGPGFTISPTTGKVVYVRHIMLATATPADFASKMCYVAQKANEWRKTYFLPEAPVSTARRSRFARTTAHL
ncbi:MAG TPA: CesT family type III secretion system chaperone [Noviherbaspirillum sp.]